MGVRKFNYWSPALGWNCQMQISLLISSEPPLTPLSPWLARYSPREVKWNGNCLRRLFFLSISLPSINNVPGQCNRHRCVWLSLLTVERGGEDTKPQTCWFLLKDPSLGASSSLGDYHELRLWNGLVKYVYVDRYRRCSCNRFATEGGDGRFCYLANNNTPMMIIQPHN